MNSPPRFATNPTASLPGSPSSGWRKTWIPRKRPGATQSLSAAARSCDWPRKRCARTTKPRSRWTRTTSPWFRSSQHRPAVGDLAAPLPKVPRRGDARGTYRQDRAAMPFMSARIHDDQALGSVEDHGISIGLAIRDYRPGNQPDTLRHFPRSRRNDRGRARPTERGYPQRRHGQSDRIAMSHGKIAERCIPAALFDGRGAHFAGHFVLRTRAAGTPDRADQFPALHERDAAARGDDTIDRHDVVEIVLLNGILERLGLATERSCGARLVLRDLNRCKLRPVHALEGDEVASRVHDGDIQLPVMFFGFGDCSGNGGRGALERYRRSIGNVEWDLVGHCVERIRGRRLLRAKGGG